MNPRRVAAAIATLALAYAAPMAMAQTSPGDISRQVEPARPSVLPQLHMQPPPHLTQAVSIHKSHLVKA